MPETLQHVKGGDDDVRVVQFTSPKILSDVVIAQIGRELMEACDEAESYIVVNFRGVTFMSNAMIGKIALMNKAAKAKRKRIVFCNISPSIMEVFVITRLNKVFSIYKSEEEALTAFAKRGWFG